MVKGGGGGRVEHFSSAGHAPSLISFNWCKNYKQEGG